MSPTKQPSISARRGWLLLIATMALASLLLPAAIVPHKAYDTAQAGDAATPAQLATPTLVATHTVEEADEPPLAPFPAGGTETMTETVRLVLAAYAERLNDGDAAEPVAVPNSWSAIYLPSIRFSRSAAPAPEPTPTPTPRPAKPADLAVTIWPWPSIIVAPGGQLAYELRVKNYGRGDASSAVVTLPYTTRQLVVIDSLFSDPGDWVSEVADDHLDVSFGSVEAGEHRTAMIVFRVNTTLPDRAVISMRASYTWSDRRDGGGWTSNWAPVLTGAGNESAPWVWLTVDPLGGWPGTTHQFFTDRFIPSEGIYTWLNTPDGVRPLELRGIADSMGRVRLDFQSTGLRPGTYQLVLYGARSNLTAVATFYVW